MKKNTPTHRHVAVAPKIKGERKARQFIKQKLLISAIREIRNRNNLGLKEAKDIVDGWAGRRTGQEIPAPVSMEAALTVMRTRNTELVQALRLVVNSGPLNAGLSDPNTIEICRETLNRGGDYGQTL